jgi:hypothetical protein
LWWCAIGALMPRRGSQTGAGGGVRGRPRGGGGAFRRHWVNVYGHGAAHVDQQQGGLDFRGDGNIPGVRSAGSDYPPQPMEGLLGVVLEGVRFPATPDSTLETAALANLLFRHEYRLRADLIQYFNTASSGGRGMTATGEGACWDVCKRVTEGYISVAFHACLELRERAMDPNLQAFGQLRRCGNATCAAVRSLAGFHLWISNASWENAATVANHLLEVAMNGAPSLAVSPLAPEFISSLAPFPPGVQLPMGVGAQIPDHHAVWVMGQVPGGNQVPCSPLEMDYGTGWETARPDDRKWVRTYMAQARELGLLGMTPPMSAPHEPVNEEAHVGPFGPLPDAVVTGENLTAIRAEETGVVEADSDEEGDENEAEGHVFAPVVPPIPESAMTGPELRAHGARRLVGCGTDPLRAVACEIHLLDPPVWWRLFEGA